MDGTLSIIINTSTLLAVVGIAVRIYLASRNQTTIKNSPLRVESTEAHVAAKTCDDARRDNEGDHQNLFYRVSAAEQRISVLEGTITEVKAQYKSIDDKLIALLRRTGGRET